MVLMDSVDVYHDSMQKAPERAERQEPNTGEEDDQGKEETKDKSKQVTRLDDEHERTPPTPVSDRWCKTISRWLVMEEEEEQDGSIALFSDCKRGGGSSMVF